MRPSAWLFFLLFGVTLLTLPPTQLSLGQSPVHSKSMVNSSPIRVDPCYRTLGSTNKVTAYGVIIPPHGTTLVTPHPDDYLVIALSSLQLEAIGSAGISYPVRLADEEMQVMKGGWSHRLNNVASDPAILLEIDVQNGIAPERALCGLAASPCTDGRFGKTIEGTYTMSTLFDTPKIKLWKIELGPGGVLERQSHSVAGLLIALTPIHLADGMGNSIVGNRGDTRAYTVGTNHQLQNIGSEEARFLELDPK